VIESIPSDCRRQPALYFGYMRKLYDAIIWLFIFPGDLISDRLGVTKDENRDLVRMLVNSLFWIVIVVIGLAIWTSTLPIYQ
jgi:hypothetical protein